MKKNALTTYGKAAKKKETALNLKAGALTMTGAAFVLMEKAQKMMEIIFTLKFNLISPKETVQFINF
ncbi:MAG TPA: hypothetical protein VIJ92_08150 [Ginsengibacter sp.]